MGSSCLIRSLPPAPLPASAEATASLSAAEDVGDDLVAVLLVDLVDADTAVEQSAGGVLVDRRLEFAGVDAVRLHVLLDATHECGHQGADGVVHLALIGAELPGDVLDRDLCEEFVEACHVSHLRR